MKYLLEYSESAVLILWVKMEKLKSMKGKKEQKNRY